MYVFFLNVLLLLMLYLGYQNNKVESSQQCGGYYIPTVKGYNEQLLQLFEVFFGDVGLE